MGTPPALQARPYIIIEDNSLYIHGYCESWCRMLPAWVLFILCIIYFINLKYYVAYMNQFISTCIMVVTLPLGRLDEPWFESSCVLIVCCFHQLFVLLQFV
jgi:hypothetical protein